jgi:hypothetical protein
MADQTELARPLDRIVDPGKTTEPGALSYAPTLKRRRRTIWRGSLAVALALLSLAWWGWGGSLRLAVRYEYAWQRCMRFSLPTDKVVYEEEPSAASKLLRVPEYQVQPRLVFDRPWYPHPPADFVPPACYAPARLVPIGLREKIGAAFVGGRTSPKGVQQLIVARYGVGAMGPEGHVFLMGGCQFGHGSWRTGAAHPGIGGDGGEELAMQLHGGEHLRLMAGQPDPADTSHFTIPYWVNANGGIIDGWLRDPVLPTAPLAKYRQEVWVELHVRDGPAADGGPNVSPYSGQ